MVDKLRLGIDNQEAFLYLNLSLAKIKLETCTKMQL